MDEPVKTDADVLIVSTDSRSMNKQHALNVVASVTKQVALLNPGHVYKKTDSVMRGYIADELKLQMAILGLKKSLLLPANPSLGRTVSDGRYYVNNVEIDKTGFANDPEFPVQSSDIRKILGNAEICFLQKGDTVVSGINMADVQSTNDLQYWAGNIDGDILPAGAGDFFEALLGKRWPKAAKSNRPSICLPHLYVRGTAFAKTTGSQYMAFLTAELIKENAIEKWLLSAEAILNHHQKLVIAFDHTISSITFDAFELRNKMAGYVRSLIEKYPVSDILIEGGSTATSVLKALGLKSFEAIYEWERGVVQMKAGQLNITVKPGSYNLPEEIRLLYKN